MSGRIIFLGPEELLSHENAGKFRAWTVLLKLLVVGKFTTPLLVDESTKTILDGHHRRVAARILGLKKIPCWCVSYLNDASIELRPRRRNIAVNKEEVIRHARVGIPYPRKTTQHIYRAPKFEPIPLRQLKQEDS